MVNVQVNRMLTYSARNKKVCLRRGKKTQKPKKEK